MLTKRNHLDLHKSIQIHLSGGYAPPQMTPQHVAKLKPGDRIYAIRVHDPLSPRPHSCRGEVVAQLPNGIVIRTDNPEDGPDGELYSLDDPRLFFARSMDQAKPGARPWLGTHGPRRGKH
jgi:hypothetical protein